VSQVTEVLICGYLRRIKTGDRPTEGTSRGIPDNRRILRSEAKREIWTFEGRRRVLIDGWGSRR
jgi:hypothetical protein